MTQKWQRERKGKQDVEDAPRAEARRLQRPLGQGEALDRWVRAARRLQLPHGLVVEGARGVGKTTVLQYLTAALLCPSELDPDEPCGVCRTCTRIANDLHPDVHVLQRASPANCTVAPPRDISVSTCRRPLTLPLVNKPYCGTPQ